MPVHPSLLPDSCPSRGSLPPDECSPPPVLAAPLPYPPPPPASAAFHGRSTFVTALIVAGSVLAFLALCLSLFLFVRRMRQRRQREALLEAALAPAAPPAAPPGPAEEVVHHAWHIRTVGLDEAAIESIAFTRYRAPGGALGAASDDCTVCLGEFQDGELLRLLPQCAHAFHVQCIDTWLRAHVSCPLCRATVVDPAAAATEQPDDPAPPAAGDDDPEREQEQDVGTPEHEQPVLQHADERQRQLAQIEQRDQESSSPERPHRHPIPWTQNFRRVASMDSPSPIVSAVEAREHGGAKQGTCDAVCCEVSPGSAHLNHGAMKRSLSAGSRWTLLSRQCRTRTSLLPL